MPTSPSAAPWQVRGWTRAVLAGRAQEALDQMDDSPPERHSASGVAWRLYVRALALNALGRADDCLHVCREALVAASPLTDGGPECLIRLLRAAVAAKKWEAQDVVDDLTAADAAMSRTAGTAVRAWCSFCFAWACVELNLHDLGHGHLAAAAATHPDPFVPELPVLVQMVRCRSLLAQVTEAELAGDDRGAIDLRQRAMRCAMIGEALASSLAEPRWDGTTTAAVVLASWRDDPTTAVTTLEALLQDRGTRVPPTELGELAAALVGALAQLGRIAEATERAYELLATLGPGLDARQETAVRLALLAAAAEGGDPVAQNGLLVARAHVRELAAERRRAVASVAAALETRELAAAHLAERRAAREDPLTGVGNRRAMAERIAAASTTGEQLAVVAVDVDDFKAVNDRFGHAVGDEVLVAVARLLVRQCRADDLVCRTGGDEFALVLSGADQVAALTMIDRIASATALLVASGGAPHLVGTRLSMGSAATSEGTVANTLLAVADLRMYESKPRYQGGSVSRRGTRLVRWD